MFESRFKGVLKRQRENRARRRSVSSVRVPRTGEVPGNGGLEDPRKVVDPGRVS